MLWVLLVVVLLLGAVAVLGLAARSLYVRGRRLAGELAAASAALQASLDAIAPPADGDHPAPSVTPAVTPAESPPATPGPHRHGVR